MKKIVLLLLIFVSLSAQADRRNYVWTYQYVTMPKGATELEFYQTTKVIEDGSDKWEYRIEVEQGLTDRWDVSLYQIFSQIENEDLKWDAVQFRTRYRFAEEGQLPVDPLLYLEYRRKVDSLKKAGRDKYEAKMILAKTIDQLNVSVVPVYEFFPDHKYELGLDVGVSWEVDPKLVIGLESTSRFDKEKEAKEFKIGSYFGPTISFASGESWFTAGVAFGMTEKSDKARVRFLIGIGL